MVQEQQHQQPYELDYRNRSTALTIAGSDSGGGAGIQADLKTFSFYGVHGTSVLTSLTAQNSTGVQEIENVSPDFVKEQFNSVALDFNVNAVKTGMLANGEIIDAVVKSLQQHELPNIVVDPVMVSQSGDPLLEEAALDKLTEKLFPLAKLITPNIPEAQEILDTELNEVEDLEDAAAEISKTYEAAVVLKGGHLENEAVDILAYQGEVWKTESPRVESNTSHGSGCAFSASLAANLAMDRSISESVERAKNFITEAIRWGARVGEGAGCVEPGWGKFRAMEINKLQSALTTAVQELRHINFGEFIPEVQTNFAYALDNALFLQDVVGFPGRIVKFGNGFRILDQPSAGASEHMGNIVMSAKQLGTDVRAAINLRYDEQIVRAAMSGGLDVFEHSRESEPVEIREEEGESLSFAIQRAYEKNNETLPDVIFDRGAIGKEAMVRVLGTDPADVVKKVRTISTNFDGDHA